MIQLTALQKQNYWNRVQDALKIAGAPTELADGLVLEVDRLPENQQDLFYHAEPLDVARDLSGVERWSDEQVRTYIEQSRREWVTSHPAEQPGLDKELLHVILKDLKRDKTFDHSQELSRIIDNMEAEKRYTRLGLLLAEIVGLAGLVASIVLAVLGFIPLIPSVIFLVLTLIIGLLLRPRSISVMFESTRNEKTIRRIPSDRGPSK